jgi:hypothetical protein
MGGECRGMSVSGQWPGMCYGALHLGLACYTDTLTCFRCRCHVQRCEPVLPCCCSGMAAQLPSSYFSTTCGMQASCTHNQAQPSLPTCATMSSMSLCSYQMPAASYLPLYCASYTSLKIFMNLAGSMG